MKNRNDHLKWCKQRAHEAYRYAKNKGDAVGGRSEAIASMLSDLGKHPETAKSLAIAGMLMDTVTDEASLIRFIDGFN